MARATTGRVHHKRSKRLFKDVKGFIGGRRRLFRTAKDARRKALQNEYKDRRVRQRVFRSLWITRIGAAAKICDLSYSKLIASLKNSQIELNRKMLAEIAVRDMETFKKIVEKVKH